MRYFKKIFLFNLSLIFILLPPVYAGSITGTIYLAPELIHRVSPADTVYIMAQSQFGPTQPLAMKRCRVMDLPMDFTLSDADARMPGLNISAYPEVRLIGWVTKSGFAYLEPGDFQGIVDNVRSNGRHVKIIINQIAR
jgi:cytochrome c-type biogenesis protein CcmH